jgi:hypothetical protein
MAGKFNAFFDNLGAGLLGPKGNMADWQHASRLFVDDNQRLAPKNKFLYHVNFGFNSVARSIIPDLTDKHNLELGMLVKSAELPKYTVTTETRNKYNRKKVVPTSIQYEPVTITFHDDNYGVTTALLEAYYRYYFRDGNYGSDAGAYQKVAQDQTYLGTGRNQYKYGLDNDITIPFFNNIQISQMARKTYTTYTLVNPFITNWQHDTVDSEDGGGIMVNTITVAYEAVHYDRGQVEAGPNGNPKGFGTQDHYDVTPSPITLEGGGTLGLGGIFGGAIDLYTYITQGTGFNSPLAAGIAAANLFGNVRNLSSEGLRAEGFNLLTNAIGAQAGIDVSGVSRTFFPKNGGTGGVGAGEVAVATVAIAGLSALSNQNNLANDSAALEAAAKQEFAKDYQNSGGIGGVNGRNAAYNALPQSEKQVYRNKALGNT